MWQGYKIEPQTESEFERQLLQLACGDDNRPGFLKYNVNSVLDPVYKFIRVSEFDV